MFKRNVTTYKKGRNEQMKCDVQYDLPRGNNIYNRKQNDVQNGSTL